MIDEPSPSDPDIICVSFAEPYILILREDSSMMVLKADGTGDLEEVDIPDSMTSTVWISGSLFDDPDDFFCLETDGNSDEESENILLFLLGAQGALQVSHFSKKPAAQAQTNGLRSSDYLLFKSLFTLQTVLASFHPSFRATLQSVVPQRKMS